MPKLYYITRTYPDGQNSSGGSQMREAAVNLLRKSGLDVWVICPSFNKDTFFIDEGKRHIFIPLKHNVKLSSLLESVGLIEDYLDTWIKSALAYLSPIINSEDILFATSGGELGTIKLASKLKETIGCRYIANFRDPILYTTIQGEKLHHPSVKFKIANRDKLETKYLKNSDRIITSSTSYLKELIERHPNWESKISNNHFGYIKTVDVPQDKEESLTPLTIVYGGNMGKIQSPEILAEALQNMENTEAHFIGNYAQNKALTSYTENITLTQQLSYKEYNNLVTNTADVGFTSLVGGFSKLCVPSKIYEYINLGLPILGVFQDGDAKDIINDNGYGIACSHDTIEIRAAILRFQDWNFLTECRQNILKDKQKWAMSTKIKEVIKVISDM